MSDRRFYLQPDLPSVQRRVNRKITTPALFRLSIGQILFGILAGTSISMGIEFSALSAESSTVIDPTSLAIDAVKETSNVTGGIKQLAENSDMKLGVVRSAENAGQWDAIDQRIRSAGLTYQVIEIDRLEQDVVQAGITVLLLPNISQWTTQQVLELEALMSQGVRVIVTGPFGMNSSVGVRQALISMVGASWQAPLPQPQTMEPLYCRTQVLCPSNWIPENANRTAIAGGILSPNGFNSQIMTTWGPSPGNAAVIITDRTTFLGWEWGTNAAVDYDSAWLRAAILRTETTRGNQNRVRVGEANSQPEEPENSQSVQVGNSGTSELLLQQSAAQRQQEAQEQRQREIEQQRQEAQEQRQREIEQQQEAQEQETPAPAPKAPEPTPREDTLPYLRENSARPQPDAVSRAAASPPLVDPAEQMAPPGLDVDTGPLPISAVEAIAMRQELEHLLGRVESALLTANLYAINGQSASRGEQPEVTWRSPVSSLSLAVAEKKERREARSDSTEAAFLQTIAAIANARTMLDEFPKLVQQKDYGAARAKWLQIRELLWEHYPTEGVLAQPEIRAIWLDRGSIVRAGSERGLAQVFDNLAAAGINTVFFETVNAGYPIYPSQVAPEQNPMTRNWDPLAVAVKLAHDRGMELHAWVWAFAAGNQRHNELLDQPPDYPGPLISAHPDWAGYTNRGERIPLGQTKPFLDPANPEVRSYLLRLLEEIATRYDVDGVQLDYIRYPFQDPSAGRTYGYGKVAREAFQKLSGVDPMKIGPSDRTLWQQWTDFRVRQIDYFVSEASKRLRQIRSDLIVSVAVFPLDRHERLNKIQQNWEQWAKQGDVDLVVTMTYSMDTNRLEKLAKPWLEQADLGSALVLPAIRLLNLPEIIAVDQIQALRNWPSGGYALFAVENVSDRLHGIFERTQGRSVNVPRAPIPYRQPFAAAAARFESLQREWSYLLSADELWIRDPELTRFSDRTEELSKALGQLATEPSTEHLNSARASLSRFQSEFREWMRMHSLHNAYQVNTWKNRLETLDRLLRYGDRFVLRR